MSAELGSAASILALPSPEFADAEVGVGALEKPADGTRVVSPGGVEASPVIGPGQGNDVQDRIELQVLSLVGQGLGQHRRLVGLRQRNRAECLRRTRADQTPAR